MKTPPWNPINPHFFFDNSEDEDETLQSECLAHVNTEEQVQHNIQNAENSEHELEWDDSPEQINLQIDAEQNLENALQPRRLFSDDSDDNEVFSNYQTPNSTPTFPSPRQRPIRNNATRMKGLVRKNAFRKKRIQFICPLRNQE